MTSTERHRVLVLGGDGYLGWPTAMYLSARGHEVTVVDNYLRRLLHMEVGSGSLVPIADDLDQRASAWQELTGRQIRVVVGDLTDWAVVQRAFLESEPDTVIHYGEIPSAPYSMTNRERCVFTQHNNIINTLNILWALRDYAPQAHLVKLGTMGEYGTPDIDIEEGWIVINHNGRSDRLPFPKLPASYYHCSKVADSTNIEFACRSWGLRATDLNQGVVYGIDTDETVLDPRLSTRFDYDAVWGTAINRFCVQAVVGHPLTVYGGGGQTRGYLNIRDTLRCVELSTLHPAVPGEFRVFNQFTEQFSINELANLVLRAAHDFGIEATIESVENPRVEKEAHYYNAKHQRLLELGLTPHLLSTELVEHMFDTIERYRDRVASSHILPKARWRPRALVQV
ncbi:MAG: NAD-dependent epimerase/dehydratase family protein [Actinomycetota bacterium]|nr:NAD-dependent epimerase/dehydratase family protein [Actinomycetota bacterium]